MSIVLPNKQTLAVTKVKSLLGDPVISIIDKESEALSVAMSNALLRYWLAFPHVYQDSINISMVGEYERTYASIFDGAFGTDLTNPLRQSAYYIGIVRESEMSRAIQYSSMDAYLLNVPFGAPPRSGGGLGSDTLSGPLNTDAIIREQSEIDYLSGNVEYRYDQINEKIIFNVPVFFGQITVFHGIGFTDPTLKYIPWNHMQLFSEMLGYDFLTTIISARGALQLQTDYNLDTTILERRRTELDEKIERQIKSMSPAMVMWS